MRSQLLAYGVLLIALCEASGSDRASAQPAAPIPQTQAGKFLESWLTALNGGPSAISAFATANRITSMSVDQTIFLWATTGGLSLIRIDRTAQDSVSALMQDKYSEQLERVEVSVNETTSNAAVVSVRATARPPDLAIPRLTESAAVEALVARATESARADGFSGVLLVARGDRVVLQRGWGEANRDTHTPITVDTKFAIASTGKMFDAAAALQLVSAGKLRLDDTVGKYIPDYPNKDIASRVTIRHLLLHRGGTGGLPPDDVRKILRTPDDYVRVLGGRPPVFAAGTTYQYSNYGYILLAAVIERQRHAFSRVSPNEDLRSGRHGVHEDWDLRAAATGRCASVQHTKLAADTSVEQ
jgi:D-alanyl-D-alanine carboxypeptidase